MWLLRLDCTFYSFLRHRFIHSYVDDLDSDAKWIRQWIRRQVNINKGKSMKGKRSAGSSASTPSQTSRGPSPESLPTPLTVQELANSGTDVRKYTFAALEGFEAGPKAREYSGQSAGSYGGIISLSSPAGGYDWSKSALSGNYREGPLSPEVQSSPMHTADPGASFMVPFRSEATYDATAVSSPDFRANATQWDSYKTAHPRSFREAELFAGVAPAVPQYRGSGGLQMSSGTPTSVFRSTALGPALQNPNVPECLTAGSAYLYRLFHERLVDGPAAPLEMPPLDGGMYMAGLTRPLSSATLLPPPVPMFSPVLGYSAYPVAYPMSFCDLIHLTKTVRGTPDKDPGPSADTSIPCAATRKPGASFCALSVCTPRLLMCASQQRTGAKLWRRKTITPCRQRVISSPPKATFYALSSARLRLMRLRRKARPRTNMRPLRHAKVQT